LLKKGKNWTLYLVKDYTFTYLTTERELLRLQAPVESQNPPVLLWPIPTTIAPNRQRQLQSIRTLSNPIRAA
jgi:hypothetical protein